MEKDEHCDLAEKKRGGFVVSCIGLCGDEGAVAGSSEFKGGGVEVEYVDFVEFEGAGEAADKKNVFTGIGGGDVVLCEGGVVGPFLEEFSGWYVSIEAYGEGEVFDVDIDGG